MTDITIRVENLGKRYRIAAGRQEAFRYGSLRESLTGALSAPFRRRRSSANVANSPGGRSEQFWALRDVSFEVKRGEALGIIGRNGAGKSTLLKILSRITEPTEGAVDLYGRVGSLLEVGTGFHPELTGRENIYLNGAILGMHRFEIERKFDEIVAFAEVEKFLNTPVKHYSSGMYVRLAFAVAAHLEPEILLVDEVLAVGDAAFQRKCLGKMGAVAKEGRTVLFVSHNMGAINELCDKAILLDAGHLILSDVTDPVVEYYLQAVTPAESTREWPRDAAPGGEKLRLRSIGLSDPQGLPAQVFRSDSPIQVDLKYELSEDIPEVRIGIRLLSASGATILASTDSDSDSVIDDSTPRKAGAYESGCTIPENLLSPGHYSVAVAADVPMREVLLDTDPLVSFEVELVGAVGTRHSDHRPGCIRPRLAWNVKHIEIST
jgi:lipopolysaccharide transport system ATP-binding protein